MTSDSLVKFYMEDEGVVFTNNNSVTLLKSGQEKFDDMFRAIRQAPLPISSIFIFY